MKKPDPRSPSTRPWHPTPYTVDDVYALQNLEKGEANDIQQKRALAFIINSVCGTYNATFVPDSDRETVFAEAKRHCGLELVKLINMPRAVIEGLRQAEHSRRLPKGESHDD